MLEKHKPASTKKPSRRLPRVIEREFAKLLNTLGFSSYGVPLWDLATQEQMRDAPTSAPLDPAVLGLIVDQAKYDPSVMAPGASALPFLRQHRRTLKNSWNVDPATLFAGLTDPPAVMLVVAKADSTLPGLVDEVAARLELPDTRSILIVVTGEKSSNKQENLRSGHSDRQLLFWLDHCAGVASASPRVFALFVHVVAAPIVVFSANDLCLSMLQRYGRALAPYQTFLCLLDDRRASTSAARDVYVARAAAPFAILLTGSEEQTKVCATSVAEKDRCFPPGDVRRLANSLDTKARLAGRPLIDNILKTRPLQPAQDFRPSSAAKFDVTVTVVFHRERALAISALASLDRMVQVAKDAGLRIEARAMLDRADDGTRRLVIDRGSFLDEIVEVDCGDPSLTRNAAVVRAQGRYLTFLDGDDLWSANWLTACAMAADRHPAAIWHPSHIYCFFASDCKRAALAEAPQVSMQSVYLRHRGSDEPDFDGRDLLMENLWFANAFAPTDVFRAFPYRPNNWAEQAGIEDWRWNLETLGSGLSHLVVPETVHLIREKENGSLGQLHEMSGLLPILSY